MNGMKRFKKVIVEVTLLMEAAETADGRSLESIAEEIDDCSWVGTLRIKGETPLDDAEMRNELLAAGNDGSFFDLCEPDA